MDERPVAEIMMDLRVDLERHRALLETHIPAGWERVPMRIPRFTEEVCFQRGRVRISVGEWAVLNPMKGIDTHHGRASVRVLSPGHTACFRNVQYKSRNPAANVRRGIRRALGELRDYERRKAYG